MEMLARFAVLPYGFQKAMSFMGRCGLAAWGSLNASSLRIASRRYSSTALAYVCRMLDEAECPSICATKLSGAPAALSLLAKVARRL